MCNAILEGYPKSKKDLFVSAFSPLLHRAWKMDLSMHCTHTPVMHCTHTSVMHCTHTSVMHCTHTSVMQPAHTPVMHCTHTSVMQPAHTPVMHCTHTSVMQCTYYRYAVYCLCMLLIFCRKRWVLRLMKMLEHKYPTVETLQLDHSWHKYRTHLVVRQYSTSDSCMFVLCILRNCVYYTFPTKQCISC